MSLKFAADSTLGKLAKWLRILGFDTTLDTEGSGEIFSDHAVNGRIVLTRTGKIRKRFSDRKLVFITSNDPGMQLRQVIAKIGIRRSDLRPFLRCIRCNIAIVDVEPGDVYGQIPDYIHESYSQFKKCPQCYRVFWPGSHTLRALERIENLFEKA